MSETRTIRQQIVDQTLSALRGIRVANGFSIDIVSVTEWKASPFQLNEIPALIFRDLDEPQELASPRSSRVIRQLHCQVEVILADDAPMVLVRKILADIERAIGLKARTGWDGLASNTRPRLSRALLEQNSMKVGGSTFEYYVDYPTEAFNSYAVASDY